MRLEHWVYTIPLRLRSLFRRRQMEQELDEELQLHLAQHIEHEIARGQSPEEARRAALLAMGGVEQRKEECRDSRGVSWLEDLLQDLAYGARTLKKTPGFTVIAALVLALGIGANTAVFTIVHRVLLQPLPYDEPDRLFLLSNAPKVLTFDPGPIMVDRDYLAFRQYNHSFESLTTVGNVAGVFKMTLTRQGEPSTVNAAPVGPDFMRVLRVQPLLGRAFLATGQADPNAAVLSERFWKSRFAGDANVVGKAVVLNGVSYSIVGVMPDTFSFQDADLWLRDELKIDAHNTFFFPVIGRLKSGVSAQQAQAELATFAAHLPRDGGLSRGGFVTRIEPLRELFVADVRKLLLIFAGAVAFVFLIACANFANLLLIRGAGRQPEIAVRAALGASRGRLVRQLVTESLLLSLLGATAGLLLAAVSVRALVVLLLPEKVAFVGDLHLDAWVLGFTFALSLVTGLVFGLAPAWQATRREVREGVNEGGRNVTVRRDRLRSLLVITEVALALVLLAGEGLLVKSFLRMCSVNPGFEANHVSVISLDLPFARYQTAAQMRELEQRVVSSLSLLPGAESAAAVSSLPFGFGVMGDFLFEDGRKLPEGYTVDKPAVSANYFRTMGIPLLSGRTFTEHDDLAAPGVVVISESVARRFWPAGNAIGQRICMDDHPKADDWLTIVGVVRDVRQKGLADTKRAVVYLAIPQVKMPGFINLVSFVVKSAHPAATAAGMREAIRKADPDLPTESITTMDAIVANTLVGARSQTRLLGIFSMVALLLAAIGIYGLLACSVAERTHEIGVRMALGAEQKDILGMVLGRTLVLAATGVVAGTLGAVAVTGVLTKFLFEVTPTDPATFFVVAAVLLAACLLAAWIPARRAVGVHPLVALRHE